MPGAPPDLLVSAGVEMDVVVGGSIFCDLVFSGLELPKPGAEVFADGFVVTPGGTANRAVAAARLGARTGLLGVLGPDVFGQRVAELLAGEPHLDLRWLQRSPTAHTPVTVAITDEHDRSFITYEEPGTRAPDLWPAPVPSAAVCHTGLARELPPWVGQLRARGTTVFAGVGWDPTHTWSPGVLERLGEVDVFVPNEVEACSYTGADTVEAAAAALAERVGTVVVTRGGQGAIAVDAGAGERVSLPAVPVTAVDPTGAGDVFAAGLMAATTWGWDLTSRVRFAGLVASLSVRTLGGAVSAPRPRDVHDFLTTHRPVGDFALIADWASSHLPEAGPTPGPTPQETP